LDGVDPEERYGRRAPKKREKKRRFGRKMTKGDSAQKGDQSGPK